MFFDPIDIPDEVLEAQEQGRLVVFAGAGVSRGDPSTLPDFGELAKRIAGPHRLAGTLGNSNKRPDQFLGDLARDGVNVQRLCRRILRNPQSRPTALHRSLVDAGRPAIELFDYATDPAETRNHAAAHPDLVASLLAAMGSGPARRSP